MYQNSSFASTCNATAAAFIIKSFTDTLVPSSERKIEKFHHDFTNFIHEETCVYNQFQFWGSGSLYLRFETC